MFKLIHKLSSVPVSRQRGSILVPAAAAILVGLILLGAAQIGQYYYLKRDLQNAADLAALAGAEAMHLSGQTIECGPAQDRARLSVNSNSSRMLAQMQAENIETTCGVWDSNTATFTAQTTRPSPESQASVHVRLSHEALNIMPFMRSVRLEASAVSALGAETATFSISPVLLHTKQGLLTMLLSPLVGDVDLTALSASGVADLSVQSSELLKALKLIEPNLELNLGSPQSVLDIPELELGVLLQAAVTAVSQDATAKAEASLLLNTITAALGVESLSQKIKLFGDGGVMVIADGVEPGAALNTKIGVVDLLTTGIILANKDNLIDLDLGIAPLLLKVDTKLRVVEPPSIQMGGVGTKANSAGVRMYVNISSDGGVIGVLASLLGIKINLPIAIELSQAQAEITRMCTPDDTSMKNVTFDVSGALANVCVGRIPAAAGANVDHFGFSTEQSCVSGPIEEITALEILRTPVKLAIQSRVLPINENHIQLYKPGLGESSLSIPKNNSVNLASVVSDVVDGVLISTLDAILNAVVLGNKTASNSGSWGGGNSKAVAENLVGTGNSGLGRSITDVNSEIRWDKAYIDSLGKNMSSSVGGFLGGLLTGTGNLLGTLVFDPVSDAVCLLGLTPDNIRKCRVGAVSNTVAPGSNGLLSVLLKPLLSTLYPALELVGNIVGQLLDTLGLQLQSSQLKVHDVQCGTAYLVQ